MAVAFERIDQGMGGNIATVYDRILKVEQESSPDSCLRFTMVGDWSIVDVIRWVNRLWQELSTLQRDPVTGEPVARPCGEENLVGYRLLLSEGRIAIDITWQANPEKPSWPPIALQIDSLYLTWAYWELWGLKATKPGERPEDVLLQWLRRGAWIVGAFVLGPPLFQSLRAYFEAQAAKERRRALEVEVGKSPRLPREQGR